MLAGQTKESFWGMERVKRSYSNLLFDFSLLHFHVGRFVGRFIGRVVSAGRGFRHRGNARVRMNDTRARNSERVVTENRDYSVLAAPR
jgi:hypothetical protein